MRLMGAEAFRIYDARLVNDFPRLLDLYMKMGVKVVRTSSLAGSLDWVSPVGLYEDILKDFQRELYARNLKHICYPAAFYSWEDATDYSDTGWKAQAVLNINGEGDKFIAACKDYINRIRPDGWIVAGEFGHNQTNFTVNDLIQFQARAIREYHTIHPELLCAVMSKPFWDLKPLINAGGVNEPNVVYEYNLYYNLYGGTPASYDEVGQAYYYATTEAELINAKSVFYNYLDNTAGLALARSKGFRVWWAEVGTNWSNPNYMHFMKDAFDYIKMHNMEFSVFLPNAEPPAYPSSQILTTDYSDLNEIGYLAMEYMAAPTPLIDLPLIAGVSLVAVDAVLIGWYLATVFGLV